MELLTGRYNHKNYSKFGFLNQDEHTFAQLAQQAGYKTMITGKWQLGTNSKLPAHFGFDNYCLYHLRYKGNKYAQPQFEEDGVSHENCTENDYGPDYFSDYLLKFMEENKEHPFLAYYAMTLVHDPFNPTPESDDWDIDPKSIRNMFLAEAGFIGLIGGGVGIMLSYIISAVINFVVRESYYSNISYIPPYLTLLALVFAVVIGMLAGLFPALRAMRLSPLAAIRNE